MTRRSYVLSVLPNRDAAGTDRAWVVQDDSDDGDMIGILGRARDRAAAIRMAAEAAIERGCELHVAAEPAGAVVVELALLRGRAWVATLGAAARHNPTIAEDMARAFADGWRRPPDTGKAPCPAWLLAGPEPRARALRAAWAAGMAIAEGRQSPAMQRRATHFLEAAPADAAGGEF